MNFQILFSGKNKKNINNLSSIELRNVWTEFVLVLLMSTHNMFCGGIRKYQYVWLKTGLLLELLFHVNKEDSGQSFHCQMRGFFLPIKIRHLSFFFFFFFLQKKKKVFFFICMNKKKKDLDTPHIRSCDNELGKC